MLHVQRRRGLHRVARRPLGTRTQRVHVRDDLTVRPDPCTQRGQGEQQCFFCPLFVCFVGKPRNSEHFSPLVGLFCVFWTRNRHNREEKRHKYAYAPASCGYFCVSLGVLPRIGAYLGEKEEEKSPAWQLPGA